MLDKYKYIFDEYFHENKMDVFSKAFFKMKIHSFVTIGNVSTERARNRSPQSKRVLLEHEKDKPRIFVSIFYYYKIFYC